ncbi:hypothetical protein AMECASPLE_023736, partial [Ameca splendens]
MSRHQSQGVVLTGYQSNAELLPQTGLCGGSTSSCPPVPDRESDVLSCKTGQYSLQQNQNAQHEEDKYGLSSATGGTGTSSTDSSLLLNSSCAAHPGSQPSTSLKSDSSHSLNSRRKQPTCQRSFSQDSLDELEMDDYWKEIENIKSSGGGPGRGGEGEAQEEEQQKIPE